MKKTLINRTYTTNTYEVEDYDGMTNEEMIDACDPNNFGGLCSRQYRNRIY